MSVLMPAVLVIVFGLMLIPWILLLLSPLALASGSTVVAPALLAYRSRHHLGAALASANETRILALEGLQPNGALEQQLRALLNHALQLAPAGTRPKGCACVKAGDGDYVGVLRIFNSQGHYLHTAHAATREAVADDLTHALRDMGDRFSAPVGAKRVRCAECNPAACPIKKAARAMRAPQPMAA